MLERLELCFGKMKRNASSGGFTRIDSTERIIYVLLVLPLLVRLESSEQTVSKAPKVRGGVVVTI